MGRLIKGVAVWRCKKCASVISMSAMSILPCSCGFYTGLGDLSTVADFVPSYCLYVAQEREE